MKKVLIVEDESLVALDISESVKNYGYKVSGICANAECAIQKAKKTQPEIILMDIRLKGEQDGIDAAKEILQHYHPFIIFLTAFSDEKHIERAIALQPLGYLIKPIHNKELYALLKMAELRDKEELIGDLILNEEFSINTETIQLIRSGEYINLTKKEHQLLELFLQHKHSILSVYDMEVALWPDKFPNEHTRRSLIRRLRNKMGNQFIETIHSEGYRFSF